MKSTGTQPMTPQEVANADLTAQATGVRELFNTIERLGRACDAAAEIGDAQQLVEVLEERRIFIERVLRSVQDLRSGIKDPRSCSTPLQHVLTEIDAALDGLVTADAGRFTRMEAARDAVARELSQVRGNGRALGAYAPAAETTAMIEDRRA
jgi:hypothetical protein